MCASYYERKINYTWPNMKNIKGNIQPKKVSVVNIELSLKVKRVILMIFLID